MLISAKRKKNIPAAGTHMSRFCQGLNQYLNSGRFWQQFLADDIKIVAFACLFFKSPWCQISGLGQVLSKVLRKTKGLTESSVPDTMLGKTCLNIFFCFDLSTFCRGSEIAQ